MTGNIDPRLLQAAEQVTVSITELRMPVLIRRAVAHYNARLEPGQRPATIDSDAAFLQRVCVNWLRHTGSDYDRVRDSIRRHGGQELSDQAGEIVKRRVLAEIARCYPRLAEEARRQAAALSEPRKQSVHPRRNHRRS